MAYNKNAKYFRNIFMNNFDKIVSEFRNGKTIKEIKKEYSVSQQFVSEEFIKNNVMPKGRRKNSLKEDYFENIDTPNKAYILGLLMADGCNYYMDCNGKIRGHILISLQICDKPILEKIREILCINSPIKKRIITQDREIYGRICKVENFQDQYFLECYCKKMSEDLIKHGMIPNKSLKLEFPDLDDALIPHFLRGYFDGDGSIYSFQNNTRYGFKIISTNTFCKKVQEILFNKFNIHTTLCIANPKNNTITSTLTTLDKTNIKIILDWLYQDAELFLERKYNKYMEYFYNNQKLLA